ncbi:MAG: DUF1150 family protein [Pseudomonadota bacterium]
MTDHPVLKPEAKPIAYVRSVDVADLPQEMRAQAGDMEHLFAIHAEDGNVLALVADRDLAFRVARRNSFAPVSVH